MYLCFDLIEDKIPFYCRLEYTRINHNKFIELLKDCKPVISHYHKKWIKLFNKRFGQNIEVGNEPEMFVIGDKILMIKYHGEDMNKKPILEDGWFYYVLIEVKDGSEEESSKSDN